MQIDVARTGIRHHEAEAFLVVEELDLSFDHWAKRGAVAKAAAAITAFRAKAVATTKAITATETIAAAKAVAATKAPAAAAATEFAARAASWHGFGRWKDRCYGLQPPATALRIRQVTNDCCTWWNFGMTCSL